MQFTLELLNQFLEDMHEYSTVSAMAMGEGQEGQRVWQQWGVSILFDVECVRMCCDKFLLCVCTRV